MKSVVDPAAGPDSARGQDGGYDVRAPLRTMTLAGLLAIGSSTGLGVSTARACDHGPEGAYGRTDSWGYRAEYGLAGPGRYDLADSGPCPICHPAPPVCETPAYESASYVVRQSRRVTYRDYGRAGYVTGYSSPRALPGYAQRYGAVQEYGETYPTPQSVMPYRPRYETTVPVLPYPSKQGPTVYATPQDSEVYSTPEEQESYAGPVDPTAAPPPPPVPSPAPPIPTPPIQGPQF